MCLLGRSNKDLFTFDVNTIEGFSLYRQFKTLAGVEPYMMLNLNRHTIKVYIGQVYVWDARY